MKSWKTTVGGIIAIVTAICAFVKAMIDGDPSTNPDLTATIIAVSTGIALIKARDNDKSSQDVGIRPS